MAKFAKLVRTCKTWESISAFRSSPRESDLDVDFTLDREGKSWAFPKQVHGTAIEPAERFLPEAIKSDRPQADGIFTSRPETTIAIQTADCLPVVLFSETPKLAMVLHAGWRGLTAGIIREGLAIFQRSDAAPGAIRALLGPCISFSRFEIGPEVVAIFRRPELGLSEEQQALCIRKGAGDRWFADLQTSAVAVLINHGCAAQNIAVIQECTYNSANGLPSFRRDGAVLSRLWTSCTLLS